VALGAQALVYELYASDMRQRAAAAPAAAGLPPDEDMYKKAPASPELFNKVWRAHVPDLKVSIPCV
jgi:hypothetical protein